MSDQQATTRAQVTQALHDAIDASEGFDDGEFVVTWIAVVHMSSINEPNNHAYYLMSPNPGGIAPHIVRGLLHEGLASPLLDGEPRDE